MAFGNGQFMKIWEVVDNGNYSEVNITSSKKNKSTGKYETDFSSKYVRFVGDAHKQRPMKGQQIRITDCAVSNVYEKDGKKQYLKNPSFVVFKYELMDSNGQSSTPTTSWQEIGSTDELPF